MEKVYELTIKRQGEYDYNEDSEFRSAGLYSDLEKANKAALNLAKERIYSDDPDYIKGTRYDGRFVIMDSYRIVEVRERLLNCTYLDNSNS